MHRSPITYYSNKHLSMQQKRLRFSTLLLCLLLPLIGQLQAQTIDLGDFANPSSHFDQDIGQTAPFDFDYLSSVTQQIYTAAELQGLEGKEITKLAFQIYLSDGESFNTEYTNDLQIYLTNVSDDHFEPVAGKYHWLPINPAQDLYMKKTITLDLMDLTANGNHETSKAGVDYHTLELELDKPFVYTGQSILLSVRSKATTTAADGRSFIEFCSYPKNVKEMPIRTINKATDKAISEGFVGVLGETADRGQMDRAVMRITFRDAKPSYDPIHPVVQLTEAGSLAKLMQGMDLLKCQSITVSGPMNAEDCKTIRDNMGNLTEINIADATFAEDQLPEAAFYNMPLVRKVTLPHTLKMVGERALAQMYKLEEVVLGTQVTKICDSAFAQNSSLTKLSPMPALTSIGKYAFTECTALTTFPWPETLTTLDMESFSGSGLTEVRLPNVAVVPSTCFASCKALAKVYLGAKTTEVMYGAFAQCTALTDITVEAVQPPKAHFKAFNGLKPADISTINLFVPNDAQEAYKAANVWKDFHIVPIPGTEPQVKKYLLSYRVIGEHGTLSATLAIGTAIPSQTEIEEHTAITFTADPDLDYVVKSFKINGTETAMTAGEQNSQTYTLNIEKPTEVTVEFVHRPYTVTYSVRDNVGGTITATYKGKPLDSGATTAVGESETIIFTAHPAEHYHVKKWFVNGKEGPKPAENNQWQVISGKDYVVEVLFERDKVYYTIDVSQEGNGGPIYLEIGGVRSALKSKAPENADIRVYVEPDKGYRLDYWMVNRERINPVDGSLEYTTKATKNLRIVAYYAKVEEGNAIDAPTTANANVTIALEGQTITLTSNTDNALGTIALYDYAGRLIEQRTVADKLCTLTAPQAGMYLLSIGTTTAKVCVK